MGPFALPALHDAWLSRLLRRSQRGDGSAFRALYRALYGPVYRFTRARVQTDADADELVAQTFLKLVESLGRIDPARQSVRAYALRIARNLIIDQARIAGRVVGTAVLPEVADPAAGALESLTGAEEREAVLRELRALPVEVQELLQLRFGDGLEFKKIAALLGVSEPALRQRVSRAVRELRERLATEPGRAVPDDA